MRDLFRCAFADHFALHDDIGSVSEVKRSSGIMIGDEDTEAALAQLADNDLDVCNGERVTTGKWFIKV